LPLKLLAAAGFLSSAGARIVDPLLAPIAKDFHATVPQVSIVIAAFVLPYGLNQIILGPVGDRFGKLRVMLGALIGYTVFTGACSLAADLPMLTVLRACAGASSAGLIPVCLAYIGDAVPYALRQETVSRFLTGVVLAQTLSGPIGGLFGDHVGWRGVFVLLAACGAVVAASLAVRIRSLPDRRGTGSFERANYVAMAMTPVARKLLLATVVEGALLPGCFPFVAPYLSQHFGLSYGAVGLILAAFGIGAFGYTLYARSLIAHLGESGQILLGGGLIAGVLVLGMTSPSWLVFILVQAGIGLGYFALHTVMQARATELLPHARSTAVSTFVFLLFLGQAMGALGMGAAIAAFGYRTAFLGDAAGIILLTLWLARFMHRTGQQAEGGDALVAKRSRQAP
jgi:predicted MFS family arabinose efflux permease